MSETPRHSYDGPATVLVGGEEIPVRARLRVRRYTQLRGVEWGGEVTPSPGVDLMGLLHEHDTATLRTEYGEAEFCVAQGAVVNFANQRIAIEGMRRPPF